DSRRNADRAGGGPTTEKPWHVDVGWEGHRLVRQSDLEGAAADKFLNYYSAQVDVDITKKDRVYAIGGVYQRFIADPGETGLRADDTELKYRHLFDLTDTMQLSPSASVYLPTSFISWRESLIMAPRLQVRLDKQFGEYVNANARINGTYYWERYNTETNGGTTANPLARIGAQAGVEVAMPFHKPLSFEVVGSTYYQWYHNATSTIPSEPGAGQAGVTPDTTFSQQPITQAYGGEVRAHYYFPTVIKGVETDAMLAYARDPGSTLHDGVTHLYLFYRLQSEVYASLSARF
ncbi:MAG TPA: hypothetical protein VIF62_37015, partial [Labilithrix sp.]